MTDRSRWQRWTAAATAPVVALLAAACSSSSQLPRSGVHHAVRVSPALLARARLDACPHASGHSVSGGLPAVTLPCLGGGPPVELAGLRGPLLVNVWGSWCLPCQKEAPYFTAVYDADRTKVRFLGVDDEDDPNSALDFATHVRPPMRYPSVVDDDKQVLLALKSSGPIAVPTTLFVAASGRIVHRTISDYSSAAQLRADLARYLGVR